MIFTVNILCGLYQHEDWESLEEKEQELESVSISKVANVGGVDLTCCAHVC